MPDAFKPDDLIKSKTNPGRPTLRVCAVYGSRLWVRKPDGSEPWTVDADRFEVVPPAWEVGKSYHRIGGLPLSYKVFHVFPEGSAAVWWTSPTDGGRKVALMLASSRSRFEQE